MTAEALRELTDDQIWGPLWWWSPDLRLAVIHERRRRFGWDDGERENG